MKETTAIHINTAKLEKEIIERTSLQLANMLYPELKRIVEQEAKSWICREAAVPLQRQIEETTREILQKESFTIATAAGKNQVDFKGLLKAWMQGSPDTGGWHHTSLLGRVQQYLQEAINTFLRDEYIPEVKKEASKIVLRALQERLTKESL